MPTLPQLLTVLCATLTLAYPPRNGHGAAHNQGRVAPAQPAQQPKRWTVTQFTIHQMYRVLHDRAVFSAAARAQVLAVPALSGFAADWHAPETTRSIAWTATDAQQWATVWNALSAPQRHALQQLAAEVVAQHPAGTTIDDERFWNAIVQPIDAHGA